MEVTEFAARINLYRPSEGELPKVKGEYYIVDFDGNHRVMFYDVQGFGYNANWEGDWGEGSRLTNDEIYVWTELLPITHH